MRALFDYRYNLAKNGYPWHKTPPGLESVDMEPAKEVAVPKSSPSS